MAASIGGGAADAARSERKRACNAEAWWSVNRGRDELSGCNQTVSAGWLACLMLVAVLPGFGQQFNDPQQLQKDGIAKIDHWLDYVRRTGDAKSTVSELAIAEAELKTSLDLFTQRQDYAGASFSAIKIASIRRLHDQLRQAVTIYQGAIELAKSVNRTDYQTTGLVQPGLYRVAARRHRCRRAVRP